MATNRLKLDFSISEAEERAEFVRHYLSQNQFKGNPPTPAELEQIGNYLLWGKNQDGKNPVQRKEIQIETRNKTWSRLQEEESLDALIEAPTFNEGVILRPSDAKPKNTKEIFSREDALRQCSQNLRETFEKLFGDIDEIDLTLNFYDLEHGRRKKPPREELLERVPAATQKKCASRASSLNQYNYLKMRHLLVELRRQQFTLRDGYTNNLWRDLLGKGHTNNLPSEIPNFGTEITVRPLGLNDREQTLSQLIFKPFEDIVPQNYSKEELARISKSIWKKNKDENFCFDFTKIEHVYNLFLMYFDIEDSGLREELNKSSLSLLDTLEYYMERAELTPTQYHILELKVNGYKNQEIADEINAKTGSSYSANYISTIFRQKIIKAINEAAAYHRLLLENISFPEEFKKCICCGQTLLRDSKNFVRKSRAKDGFVNRCKRCDKRLREIKKEAQNG